MPPGAIAAPNLVINLARLGKDRVKDLVISFTSRPFYGKAEARDTFPKPNRIPAP
jgi:hypothetical protein